MFHRHLGPLLALLLLSFLPASALAELMVPTGAVPSLETEVDGKRIALPLEHTDVAIEVSGFVARAKVTQRFGNPYESPIEAVYVFPLPERAAVDDFKMRIGERVIEGEIKKREEARRVYETARRAGHTAALLEQERPNIFTQSVANIAPGESIEVTLHFVQVLPYDAGAFELAFPMVVGPRFMPGSPTGGSGDGTRLDTTEVPDASRISPPVLQSGLRSGHDISLRVSVDAGLPLRDFETPSHDVEASAEGDTGLELTLSKLDAIPNRDFVLRWWVDDAAVQAGLLTHTDERGKFFSLMIAPPQLDVDALVGQRELVFVVDVSGSMSGLPLWLCKKAMATALERVRPGDTFNVMTFAGSPGRLWESSRPATHSNIEAAKSFVDRMSAGGGTMMLDAVAAALEGEVEADRHRYVFFLTDGYVGNETSIIASARQYVKAHDSDSRRARVFTLGVGSSPNRMLIEGLAKGGQGTAFMMTNREDPAKAVNAFFRRIDHVVLTDLEFDWGKLPVRAQSIYPRQLPDLFASRPLIVQGRYDGSGRGVITLRAKTEDGRTIRMPIKVDLPATDTGNEALPSLWAREKIQALDDSVWDGGRGSQTRKLGDIKNAITRLGIDYRILTAYTSFVAVDRSRVVSDGSPTKVVQPVEVPEDVDGRAAGARVQTRKLPKVYGRVTRARGVSAGKVGKQAARSKSVQKAGASVGLLSVLGARGGEGDSSSTLGGTSVGDVHGVGGLGSRGTGSAGGGYGRGVGTGGGGSALGIGNLTTKGRGAGLGGYGKMGGKTRPTVAMASPSVQGSIDKGAIQKVIRRNQNQARYCYERELQRDPTLAGKVIAQFTIDPSGKVSQAKISSSSMGNPAVGQCLAARVKTWRFPQPKGGGEVVVNYPWIFQTPGGKAKAAPTAVGNLAPRANLGAALKVSGGLDRSTVLEALRTKVSVFKRCYEKALTRARPSLQGKVVLDLTLEGGGSVSAAKILSDTLKDAPMSSCLLAQAKKLTFPAAASGDSTSIELPLIFLPSP